MLTGSYNFSAQTPLGTQAGVLTLQAEGDALTGNVEILNTVATIENGVADGDNFKFAVTISTAFGSFRFDATGKVEGDDISADMQSPIFSIAVTGKRA